jgi:hypothetical protein
MVKTINFYIPPKMPLTVAEETDAKAEGGKRS